MAKSAKELLDMNSNDDEIERTIIRRKGMLESRRRQQYDANLEELNNLDRPEVTEDFEDSPFADRKPLINEDEI